MHLDDPEVSRHHARVILHNEAVWVQDAGSRNGIFVNGNRVSGHKQISRRTRIQIGTHQFLVQLPQLASDSSISVDLGSISTPTTSINEPPKKLILGIGGAVCLLAIVGMLAMRKSNSPGPTGLPDANPVIAEATDNTENLSAADRLARSLRGRRPEENIPDPPEGSSARARQAHELYQAGYFHDALIKYKQCTMLDQGMEICRARTDKLTAEIDKLKQEHYTSCALLGSPAIRSNPGFLQRRLLQLEPNENAEIHKGAESGIVKAKAALNIDY